MPSGICEPYMPEHCPTEICEANLQKAVAKAV